MEPKAIIEQLRTAHDSACDVLNILSDVSEQLRASNDFSDDDETEATVEELIEVADELQSSLFDLLENISVVTERIYGESSLNSLKYPLRGIVNISDSVPGLMPK